MIWPLIVCMFESPQSKDQLITGLSLRTNRESRLFVHLHVSCCNRGMLCTVMKRAQAKVALFYLPQTIASVAVHHHSEEPEVIAQADDCKLMIMIMHDLFHMFVASV